MRVFPAEPVASGAIGKESPHDTSAVGLSPSDWTWDQLDWWMWPSGGKYTFNSSNNLQANWDFACQGWVTENVRIDSLEHKPRAGTGSHGTLHPKKPVGAWTPDQGSTTTGSWSTTYSIPKVSGDEKHILNWYVLSQPDPDYPCTQNHAVRSFYETAVRVSTPDFVELVQGTNEIAFGSIDSDHSSIWYLRPEVRQRTYDLAAKWRVDYPNKQLYVTAASLRYGGINDINKNWTTPHVEHRIGSDVDFDADPQTINTLNQLKAMGEGPAPDSLAFFSECPIHDGTHVHCRYFRY